ncbi:MAG: aryl-sulfate sulfotransferase [Planctomycetes bacterium]|nr:aryl-sulfate sulfotransferase [Planctomycetota bacterium]
MHTTLVLLALTALQSPDATPRGLRTNTPLATPGYTLVAPLRSTSTYLIDNAGRTVHEWKSDLPPGQAVYLQPNGRLLRTERVANPTFRGGGQGGRLREFDWNGDVTWEYVLSDDQRCLHHDVKVLPNGNVLAIVWEMKTKEQALAVGRDPEQANNGLWADAVIEIEPVRPSGGKIVWEWHAIDHLVQARDAALPNYAPIASRPARLNIDADLALRAAPADAARDRERLKKIGYVGEDDPAARGGRGGQDGPGRAGGMDGDWTHANGIDWHPELDVIVLSSRTLSEVWVIDHSTTSAEARTSSGGRYGHGGDFLFRYGNPRTHGGEARDQKLFVQHDPQWIGGSRLLVFNNGGLGHEHSSVDEIDLGITAETLKQGFDPAALANVKLAWTYTSPDIRSSHISGAQRLANGHTLVAAGEPGLVREVDSKGNVVWDFASPFTGDVEERGGPPMGGAGPNGPRPDDANGPPPPRERGDARGDGPGGAVPGGAPRGDDRGPRGRGRGGRGPGGGGGPFGFFRADRYAPDHPALRALNPATGETK